MASFPSCPSYSFCSENEALLLRGCTDGGMASISIPNHRESHDIATSFTAESMSWLLSNPAECQAKFIICGMP